MTTRLLRSLGHERLEAGGWRPEAGEASPQTAEQPVGDRFDVAHHGLKIRGYGSNTPFRGYNKTKPRGLHRNLSNKIEARNAGDPNPLAVDF